MNINNNKEIIFITFMQQSTKEKGQTYQHSPFH